MCWINHDSILHTGLRVKNGRCADINNDFFLKKETALSVFECKYHCDWKRECGFFEFHPLQETCNMFSKNLSVDSSPANNDNSGALCYKKGPPCTGKYLMIQVKNQNLSYQFCLCPVSVKSM